LLGGNSKLTYRASFGSTYLLHCHIPYRRENDDDVLINVYIETPYVGEVQKDNRAKDTSIIDHDKTQNMFDGDVSDLRSR
jgi:hypothetical protein